MFSFNMEFVSGFWFLVVGVVTLPLYFAWLVSKDNKIVDDFTMTNFVEILLNLDEKLEDQAIVGIIGDLTGAGVETTASTLEWALLELIHQPDIMKKAQEEIDKVDVLLHAFEWSPQPGVKPNDMNVMEGINGFISMPIEPLVAVAKPCLPTQVYKGFI
ncbi:unnamed protein product [Sphagnum jensenii]|uniref:Cytochrome P450 n=1 Tax=Sphagnum jensenii TaxID=128206 RepID=A0ABP1B383_9BRYO